MCYLLGRPPAEYLGFMIGPKGGSTSSWDPPCKHIDRTNLLAYANFAPSLGADLYAQHVAPTMSYVAQIGNATPKVIKAEKWALQRITHIPHNEDTFY